METKVPNFAKEQSISTLAQLKTALKVICWHRLMLRSSVQLVISLWIKMDGLNLVADNW